MELMQWLEVEKVEGNGFRVPGSKAIQNSV